MSRQRTAVYPDAATRANSAPYSPPGSSVLALAAASLAPGQCVKLTTDVSKAALEPEGSTILQWSISAAFDSFNQKVHFVGKESGSNPYHWLTYDIASDHWAVDAHAVWDTGNASGHGYDHNTADISGNFYHVPYGSTSVKKWNGSSWSSLPDWTQNTNATGGLTWTPWGGGSGMLFYNDGIQGLLQYPFSGGWNSISGVAITGSYHDFSEYNSTADVLILGGGNGSAYYKCTSSLAVSSIAAPSTGSGLSGFTISANAGDQGIVCSDPNAAKLIARYVEDGRWAEYNITTNTWTQLTQSSGNGATPQTGLPNMGIDSGNAEICVSLPGYGCTMWMQHPSSGNLIAWLYRHS